MKLKIALLCLLVVLTGVIILSCSNESASQSSYTIAVIAKSTVSDFWQNVRRGVKTAATEYNIEISFDGPENEEDYISQNEMITSAVARGDDAIVLSAIDYYESVDAVNAAVAAGVRIVMIDSGVDSDKVSAFIGTDNYEAGRLAGEAALDAVDGDAVIGLVNYDPNSENGQEREAGLRALAEEKGAVIAGVVNVDSNTESATAGAIELLGEYPEINVIVGFNEWTTLGVGYAVEELGLADKVAAIGFDSNVVSIGMLETGEVDALIVQNPFAIGYLGVQSAYLLLSGNEIEPRIMTSATVITKDNMFDEQNQRILFRFD